MSDMSDAKQSISGGPIFSIILRTDLINIGLIKLFFSIFMPTLLDLEVYGFICDFIINRVAG